MIDAIHKVEEKIIAACERSHRNTEDVKLIAVSKTHPSERIAEAYQTGVRVFGESRAQEFKDKILKLPEDIEWHFIGHLQKNKIKYVVPVATLIHSIDSLRLAQSIGEFAASRDTEASILMEVNTTSEEAKFGFPPDQAIEAFLQINEMSGLRLRGLMTMAPFVSDPELIRASFKALAGIREKLSSHVDAENVSELSMGMSQDFEIAIEEGSTMVRIGTAIFGSREVV